MKGNFVTGERDCNAPTGNRFGQLNDGQERHSRPAEDTRRASKGAWPSLLAAAMILAACGVPTDGDVATSGSLNNNASGFGLEVSSEAPVEVSVDTEAEAEAEHTYSVSNVLPADAQARSFLVVSDTSWIDVKSGVTATLRSGQRASFTVRFDTEELAELGPGTHEGTIEIRDASLSRFEPILRTVRVEVADTGDSGDPGKQEATQKRPETFDYFVDAIAGDDSNPGTEQAPWRTLQKARNAAEAGTTVGVLPGEYSNFKEESSPGKGGMVTFKATSEDRPRIHGISIVYKNDGKADIRFEGFDLYSDTASAIVTIIEASGVEVVDCKIHAKKWALGGNGIRGVRVSDAADVLIERCHIYEIFRGATISKTERFVMRGNYVRPKAGTGIQYTGGNLDGIIEYNHLFGDDNYVGHPQNPDAPKDPHASIISVRSSNLEIRGNYMHGFGSSSGVMFYKPDAAGGEAAYSNILFENNALYDTINTYALRINNLGDNVVVRNNLLFSHMRDGDCDGYTKDARYRYSNALMVHNVAPGHDGSGLKLYNNILLGIVTVPDSVQEGNNIAWSWGPSPWYTVSPSGTSYILTAKYGGCGKHSKFFENGFFKHNPNLEFPEAKVVDWSLDPNGMGVNFGDPENQAIPSLGSIGPDGFVQGFGKNRSRDHFSVGPLEPID